MLTEKRSNWKTSGVDILIHTRGSGLEVIRKAFGKKNRKTSKTWKGGKRSPVMIYLRVHVEIIV